MAKNKQPTTVNNIKELNLEIDYDKLAEAIVKAQNSARDNASESSPEVGFFRTIGHIIINKKQPQKAYTAYLMASIISAALNIAAIILSAICVAGIWVIISKSINGEMQFWGAVSIVFIVIFSVLVALICRACANEMNNEKNADYIVSSFSALVGFAALIVAFVALVK